MPQGATEGQSSLWKAFLTGLTVTSDIILGLWGDANTEGSPENEAPPFTRGQMLQIELAIQLYWKYSVISGNDQAELQNKLS
jgi:hypothetical protein